ARMVACTCRVHVFGREDGDFGDKLHPNGAINPDTYASIAPAYHRVEKLEPFLEGAKKVSEIAILSAEHMNPTGARNHPSDD
ncbi:hypothetical protein ACDA55_37535, partial [Rhizobium ruizarguesonis]